ncbi:flavin monoamine oxidase family protein [Thaumasiovibrio subtropicus]|uniref:flavin monoamine oxidase family protein n=1 Tax=Thaumasiovibrio subtropicus TaxID=1891207 RepID=UPI00131B8CC6|nr:FAD-dependent oxidoreductase [Thaumasiovibrio subtropicus]
MNRRDFLKMCQLLGVTACLPPFLNATGHQVNDGRRFDGTVLIIGAGAAGLTAGYLLRQQGIDFRILEASSAIGGRMKRSADFADFPIPLGAEWLHVSLSIFEELVNDSRVAIGIETTPYETTDLAGFYDGETLTYHQVGDFDDRKFIGTTWFDFFQRYIYPSVAEHIIFNREVTHVDYTGKQVVVTSKDNLMKADRVILTAPVKLLQSNAITFLPALPIRKREAIAKVNVWDGCKLFIAFSARFYPTFIELATDHKIEGEKLYYDAAYGQDSDQHILGLFSVGAWASHYNQLDESALIEEVLAELDGLFDGQASKYYLRHLYQNWNTEPFAKGGYVADDESWLLVRRLGESVGHRLYFAGDAYTDGTDWSSVHAAARSARAVVEEILDSLER